MSNENDVEIETTINEEPEAEDTEMIEEEEKSTEKIKKMQKKLTQIEEEKKKILDDLQRERADFLNARKRLEEERLRDRIRYQKEHVEKLLPLCDSFSMAMADKATWEKADESWRKGVEGINAQLMSILADYGVSTIDPKGKDFDPNRDEAIGTEEVEDDAMVDKVVSVIQKGYQMKIGESSEIIRHSRVTTGVKSN